MKLYIPIQHHQSLSETHSQIQGHSCLGVYQASCQTSPAVHGRCESIIYRTGVKYLQIPFTHSVKTCIYVLGVQGPNTINCC